MADQGTTLPNPKEQIPVSPPLEAVEGQAAESLQDVPDTLPEDLDTFLENGPEGGATAEKSEGAGASSAATQSAQTASDAPTDAVMIVQDEVMLEVEKILEDGLGAYYRDWPEEAQVQFRQKGKEVSGEIANMVRTLSVQARRVLKLIHDWLLTIPSVNKFFLEQEAKIKTDRILDLENTYKEDAQKTQNQI